MAAFGNLFQIAQEPLLKELIRYVMKDEARHVAFGVLSLSEFYRDMPPGELHDREDFIIYACELMRNRLVGDQIATAMGWDREEVRRVVLSSPPAQLFRRMIFARVVPNLSSEPRERVLIDPQTSGGLLGGVPASRAEACLRALVAAGMTAAIVGVVEAKRSDTPIVRIVGRPGE